MSSVAGFSPLRFSQYARDLSAAVAAMGAMNELREKLKGHPGASELTMTYGNGGATEIYTMGDIVKEFPAGVDHEIVAQAMASPLLANPFEISKKKLS